MAVDGGSRNCTIASLTELLAGFEYEPAATDCELRLRFNGTEMVARGAKL